ncbi:hypothetical protein N8I77_007367 [Diaporthe amygdali]|uniref:Pre-rRNA-processing protein RIX1 n=1 Tax=Phomopsis amygdali TaxID=1214568 RepID=A0AAD9SE90_PHOAM|nr:hypothetical protein N8I77_007367 [Diaporthe amygdali]
MSLPPDLQVLCRRLASTDPDDLPRLCPSLIKQIQRCQAVLSQPSDQKPKEGSSESSVLVHKLRTQITTLLNNGRSLPGRFSAAILIKGVIDTGGWECLRTSEPWVRGLLSILQKNDSYQSKEIAVITLTRIYTLLHEYQALVREIATPTLRDFVTACLQIVKSPTSSKAGAPPARLVETIANALSAITPLYPTTLRPFSAQIKAAFRAYLAPAASDKLAVSQELRTASRRLLILQHYTTPKNGNADEWIKTIAAFLNSSHATADQVFRAVQESWESNSGYTRKSVDYDEEPQGGGDSADELPSWTGVTSGAERLVGLLETITESLRCPTKTPVAIPVSSFVDLTARISMVLAPKKGARGQDETQLNSAVGREEKEELWSVLPDVHIATMDLLTALIRRLENASVSVAADLLLQAVRLIDANQRISLARERGYVLLRELLLIHGPTMPKFSVNSLDRIIQGCCRDLLVASGHAVSRPSGGTDAQKQGSNNKPSSAKASSNADAYLSTQDKASSAASDLSATHIEAASALLETLLSHLPQQHLKQTLRALIDRTAVLSHNKDAMISSILNPYRTHTGKALASVFPFLARDFPRDQAVEVLRSNLRTAPGPSLADAGDDEAILAQLQGEPGEQEDAEDTAAGGKKGWGNGWTGGKAEDEEMADAADGPPAGFDLDAKAATSVVTTTETTTLLSESVPGGSKQTVMLSSTLKRKSEELDEPPAKRIDMGKAPEVFGGPADVKVKMDVDQGDDDESDSDSDGSVHLNAALDDDSDDGDED